MRSRQRRRSSCSMLFYSIDEAVDHIVAMMKQETVYRSKDYLSRLPRRERVDGKTQEEEKKIDTPSPQHMIQAVEECIRFIDSLAVGPKSPVCISSSVSSCSLSTSTSSVSSSSTSPDTVSASEVSSKAQSKKNNRRDSTTTSFTFEDATFQQVEKWRSQMCSWAFKVVDKFDFDREIVAIAFSFLDRYIALNQELELITRGEFQLMSMTAVYTAIKVMQPHRILTVSAIVNMSRGTVSARDVLAMEMEMLTALEWRIHPPTALAFVREFLPFLPVSQGQRHEIMSKSRRLTELAIGDSFSIAYPQSSTAIAAILVAASHHCEDAGFGFPPFVEKEFCKNLKEHANIDLRSNEIAKICNCLERILLNQAN